MQRQQKQRILSLLSLCAEEYARLTGGGDVGACLGNIEQTLRQVLSASADDYVSQKAARCLETVQKKLPAGTFQYTLAGCCFGCCFILCHHECTIRQTGRAVK